MRISSNSDSTHFCNTNTNIKIIYGVMRMVYNESYGMP